MKISERQEAIFGAWDGAVSILGFIFGLLLHHASLALIAIGGVGGSISATVSMTSGELEKDDVHWRSRFGSLVAMGLSTLVGSALPVLPFFFWPRSAAIFASVIICLGIATWIGFEKHQGRWGYIKTYITLAIAIGLTLGVVSAIPASA